MDETVAEVARRLEYTYLNNTSVRVTVNSASLQRLNDENEYRNGWREKNTTMTCRLRGIAFHNRYTSHYKTRRARNIHGNMSSYLDLGLQTINRLDDHGSETSSSTTNSEGLDILPVRKVIGNAVGILDIRHILVGRKAESEKEIMGHVTRNTDCIEESIL
jgi:hypothetical protein